MNTDIDELTHERNDLANRVAELEARLEEYRDAVGETTERLGHEGDDPLDLTDTVGQLERLLEADDLDVKLEGIAEQLRYLIKWAHVGGRCFRLFSRKEGTPVRLTSKLAEYLNSLLTAEELYDLTTLAASGVELDDEIRGMLQDVADTFNSTPSEY